MRRLVLLALVGLVAQLVDGSLGMGYGVTSATLLVAAGHRPGRRLGGDPLLRARHHAGLRASPTTSSATPTGAPSASSRCPASSGAFAGATLLVNLDTDVAVPVVAVLLIALGTFVTFRFLTPRRLTVRPAARRPVPRPARPVRRRARRGRRRRLGSGRHVVAARVRPARAAQGGRLGRHRRVRRRGRRLARLPGRPRRAGHRVGLCARADGRRRRGRADRGGAGPVPAGPGARRGRRRPDRAHQPADAGRPGERHRRHRGAARLAGLHPVGAVDRVGGQARPACRPARSRVPRAPVGA